MDVAVGRVSPGEVVAEAVERLGLDPTAVDLFAPEALAASVRRAASVLCPATPQAVAGAVCDVLEGLPGFGPDTRSDINDMVDAAVSYGDLLELPLDEVQGARRHLFLGPPSFVRRASACIVIGIRPDGAPLLGDELAERLEDNRHVRLIREVEGEDIARSLVDEGLIEVRADQWLRTPRACDHTSLVDAYAARLATRPATGDVEGVRMIGAEGDIDYYRGRWRSPRREDSGHYVARRPQAYGAELWSFVSVTNGRVDRVLDLPAADPLVPGADEAWRLQAAIDASGGRPQRLRARKGSRAGVVLADLFGPIPSWAQRRLDTVATPGLRSAGALMSYQLPEEDLPEEWAFLENMLWMELVDERIT